ncbi:MAG: ADP-ribosyl-(dinitrogen reductase) hydrolase [Gammaproteobacteria bacterium]|nr:ADP-ribosyl-(dinitrogen reductase) hydrolase [Gammaproteobacteria bacterium]
MKHGIKIDSSIERKLKVKHNVLPSEVLECFANVQRGFLIDPREEHKTDPPTHWFIEETDKGRWLFVAFMMVDGTIVIKTAFDADESRKKLYMKLTSK